MEVFVSGGDYHRADLRLDGSLLDAAGYDCKTRLYHQVDPGLRLPVIKEMPTRDDALAVLARIKDLVSGFCFKGDTDLAVGLSGILTAVLRGAMSVAPLHLIRAPTAGTGKSFLVDLASTIATGRRCPVISAGRTEEELEKRLGSLLLAGVPIISIDNATNDLGGEALCQATERHLSQVRILGKSEMPEIESRATIFATGNNISVRGDMIRRVLIATLDANEERPELRKFSFNPVQRAKSNRGALIADVITIARAYRAAGMPEVCGPIGSYDEWSAMVRAPLIWLGEADPVKSMETARDEDQTLSAERQLIDHLTEHLEHLRPYTAKQITDIACERYCDTYRHPEFHELLMTRVGKGRELTSLIVGLRWLKAVAGKVFGACRLDASYDTHAKALTYTLRPAGDPAARNGDTTTRKPPANPLL
jgi:putative DNA primase/helicase